MTTANFLTVESLPFKLLPSKTKKHSKPPLGCYGKIVPFLTKIVPFLFGFLVEGPKSRFLDLRFTDNFWHRWIEL